MLVHLVAHARPGLYPLSTAESCWRLWRGLRRALDSVLAAHLMPNHLHLVAATREPGELRHRVARALAGFARSRGAPTWLGVAPVELLAEPAKLARVVRYVLLNGARGGLCDDPASATWSTHRDLLGATLDPWACTEALADQLGYEGAGFVEWFHSYVSSDPSVAVAGTPLPVPAPPRAEPVVPLTRVLAAANAVAATSLACPRDRAALARHAFVLAAGHQGFPNRALVGRLPSLSAVTVGRLARTPDPRLLRPTLLCLNDPRLLAAPRFRREGAAPLARSNGFEPGGTVISPSPASP